MALSASFTPHQSSLLCGQKKPNHISPTTTSLKLLHPQYQYNLVPHKLVHQQHHPNNLISRRSYNLVKASSSSLKWEKGYANVEVFTKEHLAVTLAYDVAHLSNQYTKEKGSFAVVLSGGSLIKYLRKLVESPYADTIDWSKWHVFWVDERVLPKTHLDSNYKLAFDGFLSKVQIPSSQIYGIDDALPAEGAADVWETNLRMLVKSNVIGLSKSGFPQFDLMFLGMGADGHVASLFPGHPALREDKKWVTHLTDSPKPPAERITYTVPVINAASNIAMVVTGAGKANAVRSALEDNPNKTPKLPVEFISPEEGHFKWYLDKGAASNLFKE